jgi:Mce-associated membrane protein
MLVTDRPLGRWRLPDLVLVQLVVLVLAAALAVALGGARVLPWNPDALRDSEQNRAVAEAAEAGVHAFLDVDYRDIDDRSARVLDVTTGAFRQQYAVRATDLRIATMRARSVAKGTIRAVGVHQVSGEYATAVVAADSELSSLATRKLKATKSCPKAGVRCNHYRFLVTLTRVNDQWLMSDLAEVL